MRLLHTIAASALALARTAVHGDPRPPALLRFVRLERFADRMHAANLPTRSTH